MINTYISKDIAKLSFYNLYHETYSDEEIIKILDSIPAADVVPVRHGKWKYDDFDGDGLDYQCTICKRYSKRDYNYCPNCGAKMEGRINE